VEAMGVALSASSSHDTRANLPTVAIVYWADGYDKRSGPLLQRDAGCGGAPWRREKICHPADA
jgi:hypothetical protein